MTIYIKIEKDSDEVSVTFVTGDVHATQKMTKAELIKYISGNE
jgi:hypothetical protein